jgi:hypothetical protein
MDSIPSLILSCFAPSIKSIFIIVICIIVFYYAWYYVTEWRKLNHKNKIDKQCQNLSPNETIFISIINNQNTEECAKTVFDLFEKAYCPFRLSVGIVQYVKYDMFGDNSDYFLEYYKKISQNGNNNFSDRIRIISQDISEYKGTYPARHIIETKLFKGEKFYMIIGNKMMFVPNWDQKLVEEWGRCIKQSSKPILTSYPEDFKPHNRSFTPENFGFANGSYLRFKNFGNDNDINLIEIEGVNFIRKPSYPMPGLFWSGIFSFGLSKVIEDVPFDPNLEGIDNDFLMGIRLWTNGYDFYHPTTSFIYYMWDEDNNHNINIPISIETINRIKTLLGYSSTSTLIPPYGLGIFRSLSDYQLFIGVNVKSKTMTSLSGVLGVEDGSEATAILCRFGSWKNFEKLKTILIKTLYGSGSGS